MSIISNFSLTEASLAVVSIIGAFAACLRASQCKTIETPCVKCVRDVPNSANDDVVIDIPTTVKDSKKNITK